MISISRQNTRTWKNIHAVICHAKHAYINNQSEHSKLEENYYKINYQEQKINKMSQIWKQRKKKKTKLSLDTLIIEMEEELTRIICELILFSNQEKTI